MNVNIDRVLRIFFLFHIVLNSIDSSDTALMSDKQKESVKDNSRNSENKRWEEEKAKLPPLVFKLFYAMKISVDLGKGTVVTPRILENFK